jgi:uncharacterized protein YbjT (DUF2867 family)
MILVTGAGGNVGSAVVASLVARGAALRIGARRPDKVVAPRGGARSFAPAVRGCDALFLLRPPQIANVRQTLNPLIDAARLAGVRQVVFISVAGAGDNRLVPHYAVEQHLKQGPSSWTILRPGFFAQNFGDAYRHDIVRDDRVVVPAGQGHVAFIDVRDMGEVAADALLSPATHHGQTYTLTGPAAITFDEAARVLSRELGRTIRYDAATIPAYVVHLRRHKLPLAQIAVQTVLHVGLRWGQAEAVDPTLARLLNHAPRSFDEYVRDHRALWLKPTR